MNLDRLSAAIEKAIDALIEIRDVIEEAESKQNHRICIRKSQGRDPYGTYGASASYPRDPEEGL